MYDYNPAYGAFDRSFETDERGQMFYAPSGSPVKVPVEEDEYRDALDKLGTRTTFVKRMFLPVYGIAAAALYILSIERGFENSYLLLLAVPLGAYAAALALASYLAIRPFERKRRAAMRSAGQMPFKFWLGYALGRIGVSAAAVAVIYVLRRLSS